MDIPKFIEENNRLIWWSINKFIKKHFLGGWLNPSECYQEAIVVIYHALPYYEPELGSISTYLDVCLQRVLAIKAARERLIILPYARVLEFPKGGYNETGVCYPFVYTDHTCTDHKKDDRIEPPWVKLEQEELVPILEDALKTLPCRYKKIVEFYFGLSGQKSMTLQQLGDLMALSKERIRQILELALEKLKEKILKKIS